MDALDKKLLDELQQNSRRSSEELGQQIGLSATACQRRIKKLRDSGLIQKEVVILDTSKLDSCVTILVEVTIKYGTESVIEDFKKRMLDNKYVQQCFYVTGAIDFVLVVTSKNMLEYERLSRLLFLSDPHIQKFHSTVVMENVKQGLTIPLHN